MTLGDRFVSPRVMSGERNQLEAMNSLRPRTGIVSPGGRNELRPYNFASCLTKKNLKSVIYDIFDDGSMCDILVAAIGKVDSDSKDWEAEKT